MNDETEYRDEVVGDAVSRLPQHGQSEDFFGRLVVALDREDARRAQPYPRRWKARGRRGRWLGIAIAIGCFLVGGAAGAAVRDRTAPTAAPQAVQTPVGKTTYAIGYSVVKGRQIAAIHSTGLPASGIGTGAFGLTIPSDWDGRVLFPNTPGEMPVIQAGNFALPADNSTDGSGAIQEQMGPSDVFIWIGTYGKAPSWMLSSPLWQQTTLPISVNPSDAGNYEGQTVPVFLLRHVIVKNQALLVGVEFGTAQPTDQTYAKVNKILSTLML